MNRCPFVAANWRLPLIFSALAKVPLRIRRFKGAMQAQRASLLFAHSG
jgi:hypothetical protein